MTNHRPLNRGSAFTLIELLVVISIIALLVGILLPALGSARRTAQSLSCLTRPRQIVVAQVMFANDHDDKLAVHRYRTDEGRSYESLGGIGISIDEWLSDYLGRRIPTSEAIAVSFAETSDREIWSCPLETLPRANLDATAARRSYSMNLGFAPDRRETPTGNHLDRWTGPVMTDADWAGGLGGLHQGRLSAVKSDCVLLGDAAQYWDFIGSPSGNGFNMTNAMSQSEGYTRGFGAPAWPLGPSQFYAHENKLGGNPTPNMGFVDGSARSLDVIELLKEWDNDGPVYGQIVTRGTIFDAYH